MQFISNLVQLRVASHMTLYHSWKTISPQSWAHPISWWALHNNNSDWICYIYTLLSLSNEKDLLYSTYFVSLLPPFFDWLGTNNSWDDFTRGEKK